MTTIVYSYGARSPDLRDEFFRQVRAANDYYNRLIAIDRERRDAFDALMAESEAVAVAKASLDAIEARLAEIPTSQRAQRAPLIAQKKALYATYKEARKHARAAKAARVEGLGQGALEQRRAAYNDAQCFWGTRLVTVASAEQACKMPKLRPKPVKPAGTPPKPMKPWRPRFRRFVGEGTVAVQIQGGMPAADALACQDSRFRIAMQTGGSLGPVPATPGSRRSTTKKHALAWIRIGSDGRDPLWLKVPFLLHRPLPDGSRIKWVKLIRRLVADRERWALQITVDVAQVPAKPAGSACGIDLGWRKVPEGLRVAQVVSDDGAERELVVPQEILSRLEHADHIRSIRDTAWNTIKAKVLAYFRANKATVPVALRERAQTLAQWRRFAKLVALWRGWERHEGDTAIVDALRSWFHQDRHLWWWEAFERRGAINARTKLFEQWALEIANQHERVVFEDVDLSALARVEPDPDERMPQKTRAQRFAAAAGALRLQVVTTCRRDGVRVIEVETAHTTSDCHACGHRCVWDRRELRNQCPACQAEWDQDANAAANILARGLAMKLEDEGEKAPKVSTRQQRMREAKARHKAARAALESAPPTP